MLYLLFDADMLVFRATSAAETEINWYGDLWTLHSDIADCKEKIDSMVVSITDHILEHLKYEGKYEIYMCFSGPNNFRKKILPTYKANRTGKRKPLAYSQVMKWVEDNYFSKKIDGLEADDIIGIIATQNKDECVVISGDKDMCSIPCKFYDFIHNEFYDIDETQADYWHLYQTLVGDAADNYKGCPKIGDVGARKILDKDCSWNAVVSAYEKAGLTEDEAIVQAQVARILRNTDIDTIQDKVIPIPWVPK